MSVRTAACDALAKLGPPSHAYGSAVAALLRDEAPAREAAATALGGMAGAGLPDALQLLDSALERPAAALQAMRVVGLLGAGVHADRVARCLQHPSTVLRREACHTLGLLGADGRAFAGEARGSTCSLSVGSEGLSTRSSAFEHAHDV